MIVVSTWTERGVLLVDSKGPRCLIVGQRLDVPPIAELDETAVRVTVETDGDPEAPSGWMHESLPIGVTRSEIDPSKITIAAVVLGIAKGEGNSLDVTEVFIGEVTTVSGMVWLILSIFSRANWNKKYYNSQLQSIF